MVLLQALLSKFHQRLARQFGAKQQSKHALRKTLFSSFDMGAISSNDRVYRSWGTG